ncbi:OPT family oligopeptide transporter [Marinoscillum furvescens]|uniref:Putative OPT family oligopeptide transporter n=1 Tax=Marinoscillum furvescens DSM 4134 TaxID=1122208 RepID=A0A3D9L1M1_MARFU|nr:oligopeptide transporter, OPT family [Marinoscillum furvescens]RED97956.1 putative OPT family oligopeptide transporter [Marinoscillum furvescens DSM 4134]
MHKPHISPETRLNELTLRSILIGALLSVVLGAANAYFGLFSGLTVSASIPAAVISMAILKAFKNSNILENNMVQTAASAGESLAAGVIFTIPALVIMGYWQEFNYVETTLISICGGVLGVLFTIPLRQALIVKEKLMFPEGIATAEVLKTGEKGGKSVKHLVYGSLIGGVFKFGSEALNLWHGIFEKATVVQQKAYLYFSLNLSPALVAVGYIVGLNISTLVFMGGVITWWIAIPAYVGMNGFDAVAQELVNAGKFVSVEGVTAEALGGALWSVKMRYLGVGAMIVGGLWALLSLRSALVTAFTSGVKAFKEGSKKLSETLRTDLDTPMSWVLIGIGVMIVPVFFIYLTIIQDVPVTLFMAVLMVVAGFLFSAVAGYMAGLVGSSNNPISGVTIATILSTALLLLLLLGGSDPGRGAAGAILVGAVVCCAAAIAGDNMQDLKAGYVLGATPRNQQVMQMIGVVAGALLIAPVLNLLLESKGIGSPTAEHPNPLTAPQATLMMSVATGIFGGELPWTIITIGGCLGVVIIIADQYLKSINSNFRMPVLAVAVGLYLPFELDSSIFIGGVIAWMIDRSFRKNNITGEPADKANNAGLLIASGLITGEALMGILIALLATFGLNLQLGAEPLGGSLVGLGILGLILVYLYRAVIQQSRK